MAQLFKVGIGLIVSLVLSFLLPLIVLITMRKQTILEVTPTITWIIIACVAMGLMFWFAFRAWRVQKKPASLVFLTLFFVGWYFWILGSPQLRVLPGTDFPFASQDQFAWFNRAIMGWIGLVILFWVSRPARQAKGAILKRSDSEGVT